MKKFISIFVITLVFLNNSFGKQGKNKETIIIRTELGDIYTRLDLRRAPVTSLNFLRYIDAGLFNGTCFYRVVRMDNQPDNLVKIEVIQGGRNEKEDKGFSPIIHESTNLTGIRHKTGTISMARTKPGSATSEFFICVGDQPELDFGGKRNPDGQGFAAFGKVTKGMEVVKRIHSIYAASQYLEKPVLIEEIARTGK
jgi:peptidyl-prolyl cis-trans isomerase A (cyclophilin A)